MDLARPIQDLVELARFVFIPYKGLLFVSGFRSGEPRVDRNVFRITSAIFIPTLIFIVLGLSIGFACIQGARLAIVSTAGEQTIQSRSKPSHQ